MKDVIIIGAGTAGMSAGVYAKRYGLDVVIIESNLPGGQIVNTPDVENYPGILKTTGVDFAMGLMEQVTSLGVEILYEAITDYDITGDVKKITMGDKVLEAKTLIIANGVRRRELSVPGEKELSGKGVSYCATCDGAFYQGKDVAIVGGGNTALEDALFLANNCNKVYLIHRRNEFRGNKILVDKVLTKENIEILYDTVTVSINGENSVSSMSLKTNDEDVSIDVAGVFVAVGQESNNGPFVGILDTDQSGFIVAGEDTKTNVTGVFVAGDSRTKALRQLITAASDGAVSAFECANFLA